MASLKKLPGKFNDDELLDIIEDTENPEVTEKPPEHSVIQFLADFGIYPGSNRVNNTILYKLYHRAVENPVGTKEFNELVCGYVQYEDIKLGSRNYLLNKESFDLTKQLAEFLAKEKKNKKVNTRFYRKHIEDFISVHFLKKGTKAIPAGALYFFYDKWQYNKKGRTRLNYATFVAMMKLYFKHGRTATIWCYFRIDNKNEFYQQYAKEIETALEWAKKFNDKDSKKDLPKEKKPPR